jgi:hypothetical protein
VARLLPWTSVEIGDVDVFSPSLPSLVVYTWYVDDRPESTILHFWRDDDSGTIQHDLLFVAPVTFDEAVSKAHEEAPKHNVSKIHVKHARAPNKSEGNNTKIRRAAKPIATKPKTRGASKSKKAKTKNGRRAKKI